VSVYFLKAKKWRRKIEKINGYNICFDKYQYEIAEQKISGMVYRHVPANFEQLVPVCQDLRYEKYKYVGAKNKIN
jgi:hypothetical protein